MAGKIYGVGVGPGDPELLTIKAARLIKNAGVIGIPAEHKETCKAYQIAAGAVEEIREKEVVPFPFLMTRDPERLKESHDRLAEKAAGYLDQGRDLVLLTLGDPTVYSTYMYLHRRLAAMGYEAEIVSGVTSFCAAAARLSVSLGDGSTPPTVYSTYMYLHRRLAAMGYEAEIVSGVTSFCAAAARLSVSLGDGSTPIHILPGSFPLEEGLSLPGTRVLMKSGKQMGAVKKALVSGEYEVIHILPGSFPLEEGLSLPGTRVLMKSGKQMGAVKKALVSGEYEVLMAENCGMEGSFPLEEGLSLPGTRVLMKSGKQMGAVKKALVSGEYEVLMAENCGMEGERLIGRAQDIPEDAGYYSLVIVKEKGETGR